MVKRQADNDNAKVHAALSRAVEQLEAAVGEQEAAANRILGLAEQLYAKAPTRGAKLQIEAIMEACSFNDLTGQRIHKVARLIKYLRDGRKFSARDLPPQPQARPERAGLSQEQIDRLIAGGKALTDQG